ncbi:MAG: GntR family transcriptional regulator [Burkholderiales bacterium]|nr:GntR family transcriptional regulator [Burkholderiales bacterium]
MAVKRGNTMHKRIADTLRDRIAHGVYGEDRMLPPELTLVTEFNVSRHTVRDAMKALVAEGLIERTAGRGTVVSPHAGSEAKWGVRSLSDLVGEFSDSAVVVLKKGVVAARSFPQVAKLFELQSGGSLYAIQRVLSLKHGPIAFHRLFTLMKYAARIPADELGYKTLIGQIEQHCRIRAFKTRQIASAAAADADVAKALGVRRGTPMLVLRRTYLTRDDEPIEYTQLMCRPDRYEQTVDFYREPVPARPSAQSLSRTGKAR